MWLRLKKVLEKARAHISGRTVASVIILQNKEILT